MDKIDQRSAADAERQQLMSRRPDDAAIGVHCRLLKLLRSAAHRPAGVLSSHLRSFNFVSPLAGKTSEARPTP
jgi:hypothetical protein